MLMVKYFDIILGIVRMIYLANQMLDNFSEVR